MISECRGAAAVAGAMLVLLGATACQPETGTDSSRESAEAASREHSDDVGTPSPAAAVAPERSVVAETLPYAEVDDQLFYGHFVFPSDMVDPLPALIVVHEWWGLNDGVRAMADRLAAEGYIVLAVDLFGGKTAEHASDARKLMLDVLENPESALENIRQAYAFVRDTAGAPRIGSLGWCFGGTWALNAALLFPEDLDAAVIYYGHTTDDPGELAPLQVPILGIFAENDSSIPVENVRSFKAALETAGVTHEIEIYPDVEHAFANPSGNRYDAEAAEQAWQRSLAFLDHHLGVGASD